VGYYIYVNNDGEYDAYLNEIKFNNVDGSDKPIVCTISEGSTATQSLVDEACNGISIYMEMYDNDMMINQIITVSDDISSNKVSNVLLPTDTSYFIVLTLQYSEGRADGNFDVAIGDIELVWSTVDVNAS